MTIGDVINLVMNCCVFADQKLVLVDFSKNVKLPYCVTSIVKGTDQTSIVRGTDL